MKLSEYHKEVLRVALDIFEHNGDDSFLDIRDNPHTRKAFNELKKACEVKMIKKAKESKLPRGAIAIRPVERVDGVWRKTKVALEKI